MRPELFVMFVWAVLAWTGPATAQQGSSPKPVQPASSQPARQAQPGPTPVQRQAFLATMDAEFRQIDADKNGILTRPEIEQFQRSVTLNQMQMRNRNLFNALDADRNGHLSREEFAKMMGQAPAPNPAPFLSQVDGNKDGQVTLVEYRGRKLANFDRMDTDKDGVVSVAEMRAAGIIK